MAKKCPETGEYVLYADCLECETKGQCASPDAGKPWFALLVVGSRSVTDYTFVKQKLDKLIGQIRYKYRIIVVSGGAKGADTLAERYARENGFEFHLMPADWNRYGKRAGYIRNREMHEYIAKFEHRGCVAFWDGISRGTAQSFELAKTCGTPLRVIRVSKTSKNII